LPSSTSYARKPKSPLTASTVARRFFRTATMLQAWPSESSWNCTGSPVCRSSRLFVRPIMPNSYSGVSSSSLVGFSFIKPAYSACSGFALRSGRITVPSRTSPQTVGLGMLPFGRIRTYSAAIHPPEPRLLFPEIMLHSTSEPNSKMFASPSKLLARSSKPRIIMSAVFLAIFYSLSLSLSVFASRFYGQEDSIVKIGFVIRGCLDIQRTISDSGNQFIAYNNASTRFVTTT
jgi:hypothetical protein